MSHRLANYHLALQRLGYETAHIGKWHMGNDAAPRPGYDYWISFRGQGSWSTPVLWEDDQRRDPRLRHRPPERARRGVRGAPARQAVRALSRAQGGASGRAAEAGRHHRSRHDGGYVLAERHEDPIAAQRIPPRPNVLAPEGVAKKARLARSVRPRRGPRAGRSLEGLQSGTQEEIRRRAAMMASVDEGMGLLARVWRGRRSRRHADPLPRRQRLFLRRARIGAERRFAYEEGIRTAFFVRYPKLAAGQRGRADGARARHRADHDRARRRQARAADPGPLDRALAARPQPRDWRKSFLIEYYNESAWPWIVGMSYKAVRTERAKLIHWVHKEGVDELYDLKRDPYEICNVIRKPAYGKVRTRLYAELKKLVAEAVGL